MISATRPAAAALLFCAALATGAAGQAPADNPVFKLPDFTVSKSRALPPPESWRYTRIENFEVLSNTSDRTTKSLLDDFTKFTRAMRLVWPTPVKPVAAASIILCGKGGKFDEFAPPGATRNNAIIPSLFLRDREQVAIVTDIATERVTVDDSQVQTAMPGVVEYEIDHYRQLYREYVRFLLSQVDVPPPVWLQEGLAQIVMDIEFDGKTLIYGKVSTDKGGATGGQLQADDNDPSVSGDAVVGEQPFNVVLQHRKMLPLAQFFAVTPDSPEARAPLGNNLWAKQAYAFVHFCLFGENLRYRDALARFVQRLAREPLSEALFKDCFKVDYVEMGKELRGYILYTRHKYQIYQLKDTDKRGANSIELRDATPAEVGLIKGDALRLAGHLDAASAAYRAAYVRGSREPALLAAMGAEEITSGRTDRARPLLEAAVKAGVNRPSAGVALARLRLAEGTASPEAPGGKLSAAQVAAVLTPLFEARKNPPLLPETYELIATVWAQSETAPKVENLAVLDEGIRAFPRDSVLLYNAAQLYRQAGAGPTAASIARLGIRFSSDPESKSRFEQLLASLPAVPAKP